MNTIASIHQKIIDNFIARRSVDPSFSFATRKIDNKQRLSEGYWFLGNDHYVHVSFWNGIDWKEKIHNIGFVVHENKQYSIELAAQDKPEKVGLMQDIVKAIPGFKKEGKKQKWYKHFSDKNYLAGIDDFIQKYKPIIDRLVDKHAGNGISHIDNAYINRYVKKVINKRQEQIAYGREHKITRITWNTHQWQRPSGPAGKSKSALAYESTSGYGHEEWLLDKQRVVDGYHYGFLQSLNLSTEKHVGAVYDIALFTNDSQGNSFYVGEICNVHCIDSDHSVAIHDKYQQHNWITEMENDIVRVGASLEKFRATPADIFFNIRFKFSDTHILDQPELIEPQDVNISTNHFKLLPRRTQAPKRQYTLVPDISDDDPGRRKNTAPRVKTYSVDCKYDPYHDKMQNALFDLLKSGYDGYSSVKMEKNYVDLRAMHGSESHFFEIKTDCPRLCLRKAIGQVMEYAYFPNNNNADKLIVIGDSEPDAAVVTYIEGIRKKYQLPVYYRWLDMENLKLSETY